MLKVWNPYPNAALSIFNSQGVNGVAFRPRFILHLPKRRPSINFTVLTTTMTTTEKNNESEPLDSTSNLTSTVGSPILNQPILYQRHIRILNFFACATAISATCLFCSAIPTLLAFKRAAESLEKLMDVAREELPDTMAAVRLSGMEISDLTMELSDLGQEITSGVKSSTRAVRFAEERLRRLTNMNPTASVQEVAPIDPGKPNLALARTARGLKEGIVKGRSAVQMLFTLTRFSKIILKFFMSRAKA